MNREAAILYTRGSQGAEYHVSQQVLRAPAPAISVADTIGAGDASIAALIYSRMLHPHVDAAAHLRFAVGAGAAACTRAGAAPPTSEEVATFGDNVIITILEE